MVEFALVLIPLLMIIMGIVEFGRALYSYSAVSNAARVGAHYAALAPTDSSIATQAKSGAAGIPAAQLTVTVQCADVATPSTFTTFTSGTNTCTSGTSASGDRVRVTVDYCFQTIVPNWIKLSALSCSGTSNRLQLTGQSSMFIE